MKATRAEIIAGLYGRRSKYNAKRCGRYASKKEAARAAELQLMAKLGVINALQEQVRFELLPKDGKDRAIAYVADFVYLQMVDGAHQQIVEDVKGFKTPMYRLKRRMMWHLKGIRIRET